MGSRLIPYSAHFPPEDLQKLETLVRKGFFANKGEAIREAVHRLCESYQHLLQHNGGED